MREKSIILAYAMLLILLITAPISSASASDKPMRLDVPNIRQIWEPWKNQKLGFGERDIENAGCALTSFSMLLRYYGVDTDPARLNTWLKENGGFLNKENIIWSKASEISGGAVKLIDIINFKDKADLKRIDTEIDNGYPVIAKMDFQNTAHYVLICGYDGGTYYLNDPWSEDPAQTINEVYEPKGEPENAIKGIIVLRTNKPTPVKVPVVKLCTIFKEKPTEILNPMVIPNIELRINDPHMTVNGVKKEVDIGKTTSPLIVNGKTLVPARALLEEMGGSVDWDADSKKITVNVQKRTIEMWVDRKTTYINGWEYYPLEVEPKIINERVMVPLRYVAEILGCKVDWDASTKTISIR